MRAALVAARGAVDGPLVLPERPPPYAQEHLRCLARLVWPAGGAEYHHELGYGYWLSLVGAFFRGLEHAVLPGLAREYDVVVVENWCYKFAAKMALKGYGWDELRRQLPLDGPIDRVFLIDTLPEEAWGRKRFSHVEMGGQDGYDPLGRDSFVLYQGRLRSALTEMAALRGWTTVDNAAGNIDVACEGIEAVLMPLLAVRSQHD